MQSYYQQTARGNWKEQDLILYAYVSPKQEFLGFILQLYDNLEEICV